MTDFRFLRFQATSSGAGWMPNVANISKAWYYIFFIFAGIPQARPRANIFLTKHYDCGPHSSFNMGAPLKLRVSVARMPSLSKCALRSCSAPS